MNAPAKTTRSLAAKISWVSLGLAVGCVCAFVVFVVIDEMFGFAHTRHGVLTGFLPRGALWVMWAGTALAVIVVASIVTPIPRLNLEHVDARRLSPRRPTRR